MASKKKSLNGIQHGGSHYKDMKIEPAEYIMANKIPWAEGSAIKYVSRHKAKGGVEDLKKAVHFLQMILEEEYGTIAKVSYASTNKP